jgi:hypothetical protein
MQNSRLGTWLVMAAVIAMLCAPIAQWNDGAAAAEDTEYKTVGGVAVYLGVVPAEIVKGHPRGQSEQTMHGGVPIGPHQYHVLAAMFDSASGARLSNAIVTAQISGLGLSGARQKLEPMEISGTTTYGGYFNLPGRDLYTVRLIIERPGAAQAVVVDFKYDHRH